MAKLFDSSKKKVCGILLIFIAIVILIAVIWIVIRTTPGNEYVGSTKAEDIALEDAGVLRENVTYIKSHIDTSDRIKVYDIEFQVNNKEYDYEINAVTGAILEKGYDMINIE